MNYMDENQITIAANALANLMYATNSQLNDILEVLAGNIIAEEDCGRIRERISALDNEKMQQPTPEPSLSVCKVCGSALPGGTAIMWYPRAMGKSTSTTIHKGPYCSLACFHRDNTATHG